MIRKFKAQMNFWMFADLPMTHKDEMLYIDTDKTHGSHINYWLSMGYLKEIKTVRRKCKCRK